MTRGFPGALSFVCLVGACAPESSIPEGRDDAVRWQLPRGFARILERPDRLELLALDGPDAFPEHLAGFPRASIRAHFALTDRHDRRRLLRSLYRSIRRGGLVALCFVPHHAILAKRGRQELTIAICLSCLQLAYVDDDGDTRYVAIDPGVLGPTLDALFEPHGLTFDRTKDHLGAWSNQSSRTTRR